MCFGTKLDRSGKRVSRFVAPTSAEAKRNKLAARREADRERRRSGKRGRHESQGQYKARLRNEKHKRKHGW